MIYIIFIHIYVCVCVCVCCVQVLPAEIESIKNDVVLLKNGMSYQFDTIVFCTGFKRSTHLWLKVRNNNAMKRIVDKKRDNSLCDKILFTLKTLSHF